MADQKVNIIVTAKDRASSVLSGVAKGVGGLASGVAAAGPYLASLATGLGAATVGLIKIGSDAEEMKAKFDTVFGGLSASVTAQLDAFGDAVGRSTIELQGMASSFQDTFVPMGFARDEAANLSVQMVKLATDLSSFNNISMDEALRRLQGTLIGSHENALAFGVVITENTLKAELAAQGWDKLSGAQLEAAKVQARVNLLMQGTTDAQGDAARTSESFANQMRALSAELSDAGAAMGSALLPVVTPLLQQFGEFASNVLPVLIEKFEQFAPALQDRLGPAILIIQDALTRMAEAVGINTEGMTAAGSAIAVFEGALSAIITAVEAVAIGFNLAASAVEIYVGYIQSLLGPLVKAVGLIAEATGATNDFDKVLSDISKSADDYVSALGKLPPVQSKAADAADDHDEALRQLAESSRLAGQATRELNQDLEANQRAIDAAAERYQGLANAYKTNPQLVEEKRNLEDIRISSVEAAEQRKRDEEEKQEAAEKAAQGIARAFDDAASQMESAISGAVNNTLQSLASVSPEIAAMMEGPSDEDQLARRLAAIAEGGAAAFQGFTAEDVAAQVEGNPIFDGLLLAMQNGDSSALAAEASQLMGENLANVLAQSTVDSMRASFEQQNLAEQVQALVAEQLGEAPVAANVSVVAQAAGDTDEATKAVEGSIGNLEAKAAESGTKISKSFGEIRTVLGGVIQDYERWAFIMGAIQGHMESVNQLHKSLPPGQAGVSPDPQGGQVGL